jgi:hypothetical protein
MVMKQKAISSETKYLSYEGRGFVRREVESRYPDVNEIARLAAVLLSREAEVTDDARQQAIESALDLWLQSAQIRELRISAETNAGIAAKESSEVTRNSNVSQGAQLKKFPVSLEWFLSKIVKGARKADRAKRYRAVIRYNLRYYDWNLKGGKAWGSFEDFPDPTAKCVDERLLYYEKNGLTQEQFEGEASAVLLWRNSKETESKRGKRNAKKRREKKKISLDSGSG